MQPVREAAPAEGEGEDTADDAGNLQVPGRGRVLVAHEVKLYQFLIIYSYL